MKIYPVRILSRIEKRFNLIMVCGITMDDLSIWQHYVPRMYLKNFGKNIRKKKKDVSLVSFYQFDKDLKVTDISVNTICAADYFYDHDNHIEHLLSKKEGSWSESIKNIIKCDDGGSAPLSGIDIENVREFAVYQYCRTQGAFEHVKKMSREILHTLVNENFPQYSGNRYKTTIENVINQKVDSSFHEADMLVEMADGLLKEAEDLKFTIVKNESSIPFITSDVPVIVMNPFTHKQGAGIALIGTVMMVPLSELHLVVIYDEKMYQNIPLAINDPQEIDKINRYEVISADERIVAQSLDNLRPYIEDKELLSQRLIIRNSKATINSSSDMNDGKMIAISSRKMPYDFQLQMFKLPNAYRKIPMEARDAFPRKYNKKHRDNLLLRTQTIRGLYKQALGNRITK